MYIPPFSPLALPLPLNITLLPALLCMPPSLSPPLALSPPLPLPLPLLTPLSSPLYPFPFTSPVLQDEVLSIFNQVALTPNDARLLCPGPAPH